MIEIYLLEQLEAFPKRQQFSQYYQYQNSDVPVHCWSLFLSIVTKEIRKKTGTQLE